MTLSQSTLDNLLEAESHIRAALKSAAVNEKPIVIHQVSKLITDIEHIREFDNVMDIMDSQIVSD